jgi:tetratricopeptide (TPR) repeat protein
VTAEQIAKESLYDIVRSIRETEPPAPSSRLSHSGTKLAAIAALRDCDPKKMAKMVRGELDWLVMKALEKDRERRYETANDFALDVQRYLNDEPVLARQPSAAYRLRKFAKRHKGSLTALAVLVLALVGGIVGTTLGLIEAREQANLTEKARQAETARAEGERQAKQVALAAAEAEKKANAQAQKRLVQLEKANNVVTAIFADLDIKKVKDGTEPLEAVLAERLVKASAELDGDAVGDPLVVARLQLRLGVTLTHLGYPREATRLFANTLETRKSHLVSNHRDTLWAMHLLGLNHKDTGNLEQCLLDLEKTLSLMKTNLGAEDGDTLECMNSLAVAYRQIGKADKALPLYENVEKVKTAKYGPIAPTTLLSRVNLGTCYKAVGKLNLALPLLEETLETMKGKLGPDLPDTILAMSSLASVYQDAGKANLAINMYEEILELRKQKLGSFHPETLASMNNLANSYRRAGQLSAAMPLMEQTVKLLKSKLGPEHPLTCTGIANLAWCYREDNQLKLAISLFEEAATGVERLRFQHEQARQIIRDLVDCCESTGQLANAEGWQRKWAEVVKQRSGADSTAYANELAILGWYLLEQKKWTDAETVLRDCVTIRERTAPESWITFNTQSMLGAVLLGENKVGEAEPVLLKSYEGLKRCVGTIPAKARTPRLTEAIERLVALYETTRNKQEAERWRKELEGVKKGAAK